MCEVPKALITLKKKRSHWPLSNPLAVIGVQNMAGRLLCHLVALCHLLYGKEWLSRLVSITHCGADVDIIKCTDEDNFAFFFFSGQTSEYQCYVPCWTILTIKCNLPIKFQTEWSIGKHNVFLSFFFLREKSKSPYKRRAHFCACRLSKFKKRFYNLQMQL